MPKLIPPALAALALIAAPAASAQSLTDAQARTIIAPGTACSNVATRGDVKAIEERSADRHDYESCSGYLPGNAGGGTRRSRWCRTSRTRFPT